MSEVVISTRTGRPVKSERIQVTLPPDIHAEFMAAVEEEGIPASVMLGSWIRKYLADKRKGVGNV